MMSTEVTPHRALLLAKLDELLRAPGVQPSLAEAARHLGITPSTLHQHLTVLRAHGLVTWRDHCPRTLRLTDAGIDRVADEFWNEQDTP